MFTPLFPKINVTKGGYDMFNAMLKYIYLEVGLIQSAHLHSSNV